MTHSIMERFNDFNFHDCYIDNVMLDFEPPGKVVAVVVVGSLEDEFIASLSSSDLGCVDPSSVTKCKIRFIGCMGVHFSNDGTGVGCIFDTEVFTESPLLSEFIVRHDKALPEFAGKEKFYHFKFGLYPAVIDIIAQDFEVELL